MPKGFAAIQEAAERASTNKKNDWGPPHKKLILPDHGSNATIRFLEQGDEVYSYWLHNFSKQDGVNGWKVDFPCLDSNDDGTPCPGCEYDLHRTFKGLINVIWRDAPVYETDSDGRFVRDARGNFNQIGEEDQVAVWKQGIRVFTMLGQKDVAYKGLGSRDFVVTRSGTKADNTTYAVEPADVDGGPQPMSEADLKLAENKYNLEEIANFKTYDEVVELIEEHLGSNDSSTDSGDVGSFVGAGLSKSPFGN